MFYVSSQNRVWQKTSAKTVAGAKRAARAIQPSWHHTLYVGEGDEGGEEITCIATLRPDPINATLAKTAKWCNIA